MGFCRERAMKVFLEHKRDQWSATKFLLQETAGGEDEMETSDVRSGAPVARPLSLPQQPCGKSTSRGGKSTADARLGGGNSMDLEGESSSSSSSSSSTAGLRARFQAPSIIRRA